jgi:hypothetical protein
VSGVRLTRVFWIGAAAILVAAALVGIAALLGGSFGETEGKILLTLLALLVAGGTVIAGLTLVERGVLPPAGWAAAATAAVGFVIVLAAIWGGLDDDTMGRWAGTAAVVVPAMLVVTTQLLLLRDPRLRFLAWGTAATLGLATALTAAGIWSDEVDDAAWKAVAALWILGVLGWLLVPVLQRLSTTASDPRTTLAERVIARLEQVDVVVNGAESEASLVIESPRGELVIRNPSGAIHLRRGERLVVRPRQTA